MTLGDGRTFTILSVLGRGGFGTVYRARLETPDGFSKEVALKLLQEEVEADATYERFRDEARMLGLIRDRAVVGVDAPALLQGRPALVMEFVEGVSLHDLIHTGFPTAGALEVVGEVARALAAVWELPGPDGRPLNLMHRDIKPGNLLITRTGDVKILDLGTAKAEFKARESKTTEHLTGTPGFIAPERFRGGDVPESDIYSLGVVLWECISTKVNPTWSTERASLAADEPQALLAEITELSAWMRQPEPERRPGAKEVVKRCRALLVRCQGPRLAVWAEEHVSVARTLADDPMVGKVLTGETTQPIPAMAVTRAAAASVPFDPAAKTVREPLTGAGLVRSEGPSRRGRGVVVALLLVLVVGVPSGAIWVASEQDPAGRGTDEGVAESAARAPEIVEIEAVALPVAPDGRTPDGGTPEGRTPEGRIPDPTEVAVVPTPRPRPPRRSPDLAVAVVPRSTAVAAKPEEADLAEEADPIPIQVSSVPLGAQIFVDGVLQGNAPMLALPVTPGEHELRMVLGEAERSRTLSVREDGPRRFIWKVDENVWDVTY